MTTLVLQPEQRINIFAPPSEQPGATDTELLLPRAGATHSDPCCLWTLPSGEGCKGYLAPLHGMRSSLDVRSRKVTIGVLKFHVLDKKTGSGNAARWFSQYFSADNGEQRLLGCLVRAYERLGTGCEWEPYFVGRIYRATKVSLLEYEVEVREINENLDRPVFVGRPHASVDYAELASLMPWHLVNRYHNLSGHGGLPCTKMAPAGAHLCRIQLPTSAPMDQWCIVGLALGERSTGLAPSTFQNFGVYAYAKDNVRVRCTVGATTGEFWLRSLFCRADKFHAVAMQASVAEVDPTDPYYLPWASLGATGTAMEVEFFAVDRLRGQQGLLVDWVHPVRMMRDLVDGYYGQLSPTGAPTWHVPRDTSVGSIWDTLEADTSFPLASFVITRAAKTAEPKLNDWMEKHLCKPFGLAYKIDGSGLFTPIDVRRGAAVVALPTITDDDLVSDIAGEGFEQSVGTAITQADVLYYGDHELPANTPSIDEATFPDHPPALLKAVEHLGRAFDQLAEVDVGHRPFEIDAIGLRYSPDLVSLSGTAYQEAIDRVATALAGDFIALYGRGGLEVQLLCRRTAIAQGTTVGDRRFLEVSGLLNPESLLYDDGVLLGRCIERAEDEAHIRLGFLIEGTSDVALAPTLGALALGTPVALGQTVDLPVTPNAQSEPVEIWIAITDTATAVIPVEADGRWQLIAQGITTAQTYNIRPLPENARIWARARTNPAYRGQKKQASAWVYPTAPGYVDTTAGTPVSGVTVSQITATTAEVTWSGGGDNQLARVYRRLGASTAGPWLDSELMSESLQPPRRYVTFGMAPSTQYTVAVAVLDPVHGAFNPVGTATFTTTASVTQCPRPAGILTVPGTSILVRVFSADISLDIEVERAPDSGGSPDLLTSELFVIPRHGDYLDPLPSDKSVWWYRARHIATAAGLLPSDWTGWVSGIADTKWIGPPPTTDPNDPTLDPGRPSPGNPILAPALPSFTVAQSSAAGVGTLTLTVHDPQLRVTAVEFQTFDGTTTSAWIPDASIPYGTTVPYTVQVVSVIRWRVLGYDANSQLVTLGSGEAYFGGNAVLALDDLLDVDAPAPSHGDALVYNSITGNWEAGGVAGAPSGAFVVLPLTTVVGGVPEHVWDANDSLIPTIVPVN